MRVEQEVEAERCVVRSGRGARWRCAKVKVVAGVAAGGTSDCWNQRLNKSEGSAPFIVKGAALSVDRRSVDRWTSDDVSGVQVYNQ